MRVWHPVMHSLHALAAAETTFGRVYTRASTRMSGRVRIDIFEAHRVRLLGRNLVPTSRVCKSVLRDVIRGISALRRRAYARRRLGELFEKTAFFLHSPIRHARRSATGRTHAAVFANEPWNESYIVPQAARVVRTFTRASEIERRERAAGELWKKSGPIDREIRCRRHRAATRLPRPRARPLLR